MHGCSCRDKSNAFESFREASVTSKYIWTPLSLDLSLVSSGSSFVGESLSRPFSKKQMPFSFGQMPIH